MTWERRLEKLVAIARTERDVEAYWRENGNESVANSHAACAETLEWAIIALKCLAKVNKPVNAGT